jgi:acetyltransferase-like isoleucine patch superfamily enzyme
MTSYDALSNVWGDDNFITIIENGMERQLDHEGVRGLKITVNGNNNRIRIELPLKFSDCKLVVIGDNNTFSIMGSKTKIMKVFFFISDGCHIKIGRNCFFNNDVSIIAKEKKDSRIIIGNNCVISTECIFRCGDGHTVIDSETGEPLNEPRDVIIGNHVWIGARTMLLKGTYIPGDSIVGAMSLVNRAFDEDNIMIAGTPARIIKHDVNWDMKTWDEYERKYENRYREDNE